MNMAYRKATIEELVFPELKKFGISLSPHCIVNDLKEVEKASKKFGFPLFMKGIAAKELHKSDKGLVKEITSLEDAKRFFNALKATDVDYKIVVQKRLSGIELFMGMQKDELFQNILVFGMGGIFVEIYRDVSYGIMPLTFSQFNEVIKSTKIGKALLKNYRNYAIDTQKLYSLAVKCHRLLLKTNTKEIEFNPIILEKSGSFGIVDVKIVNGE